MPKPRSKFDWHKAALIAGVVVLLAGVQLRYVERFICTPQTTRVLIDWFGPETQSPRGAVQVMIAKQTSHRHAIQPPRWLGWGAIAVALVLLAYGAKGILRKK